MLYQHREVIANNIQQICSDIIYLIDTKFLAVSDLCTEIKCYYLMLKADFKKYAINYINESVKTEEIQKIKQLYLSSIDKSNYYNNFNVILLTSANSYSDFLYNVCNQKLEAYSLIKCYFENAVDEISAATCIDQYPDDSIRILESMHDKMDEWKKNL